MAAKLTSRRRKSGRRLGAVGFAGVALSLVGAIIWFATRENPASETTTASPVAEQAAALAERPGSPSLRTDWDPTWDPLPAKPVSAAAAESARAAYTFVAHHPEIARHIPCFCGCSRSGHKSVESCFVRERTADGKPRWNPMGFG